MSAPVIALNSVSWIDGRGLPSIDFWFFAGAAKHWEKRVLIGLVGTANPTPPQQLGQVQSFQQGRQYRALTGCGVGPAPQHPLSGQIIDPGWTPPVDKSLFDPSWFTQTAAWAGLPSDPKFYAGESSPVSGFVGGKLHPCSTLSLAAGQSVVVSAFIKFRAGPHTDQIGVKEAKSPVHVPWVWCEYALVRQAKGRPLLLCQGSVFPSHRWYVNGQKVAERLQAPLAASDKEPALTTGQPAGQVQQRADSDRSAGAATGHAYALAAGSPVQVELPAGLL
jgi:hypothetical protein